VSADLETARSELRQTRQALERSEQKCGVLALELEQQVHDRKFLSHQSSAFQAAFQAFCPQLSSVDDMKRLYHAIAPSMDRQGFTLYHMAERLTGLDVSSFFPYEDNRGLFAEADGYQLLRYLTAAHFHAVDWTIVPGTGCEAATLREVDTTTPEYQAFEKQLYGMVLERMGFQAVLASERRKLELETGKTPRAVPQKPNRGGDAR